MIGGWVKPYRKSHLLHVMRPVARRGVAIVALTLLLVVGFAQHASAQSADPYAAQYCEPKPQTKLLYTNRAYLILPKAPDEPALYYSYKILETGKAVKRHAQFMFDDGEDRWDLESNPQALRLFWPLRPGKTQAIERVDRTTGAHAHVTFTVLGLEPVTVNGIPYKNWKIRRLDSIGGGKSFAQLLWYAPALCTLSAFTDSQHRTVRLLRVLNPGDRDYDREVVVKEHHLYFADNGEMVK